MFGRTPLGNRRVHGVVGYACSPTMQTPSPTQKPLAGMHASAAAAERVFSAQPIVQETESARGTDEKDERDEGSLLRRLTALPPRQQDRAGEPADRSRDMLKLVRPCRPSLASTRRRGGKRKEHPVVQGYRFGLGQLLRGRVRPMAEDSPSGERLAGQSGLVFHIVNVEDTLLSGRV